MSQSTVNAGAVKSTVAEKKQAAAKRKVSRQIQSFYARSFPGKSEAPEVFWDFVDDLYVQFNQGLQDAGGNQSRIDAHCRKFVDLFRKACVRARQLTDDQQVGAKDEGGGALTRGEAARQALEDAKRPEDYLLW